MIKHKWSKISGSINIEIGPDDNKKYITPSGKELPESFQKWAKDKDIYDLVIEFESSGYYEPMSMYGGPDNLGWPGEWDDERIIIDIKAELQNSSEKLPKELWDDLYDFYEEKIYGAELDFPEPDYDDYKD